MSSLTRRLAIRIMKRARFTREKWIIVRKPNGKPEIVNVKRGGEITDPDDNPIGRRWPALIPARAKMPTLPVKKRSGPPRGQRRGTRSKKYIEARKRIAQTPSPSGVSQ